MLLTKDILALANTMSEINGHSCLCIESVNAVIFLAEDDELVIPIDSFNKEISLSSQKLKHSLESYIQRHCR
ncbi:hypothetical protein [Paraferrimonas sp. SM1919]|uniref:hypothetical protein n=1 Tax=Paraferrimonas sp. SM1919 TaxID=2662263 RepID=UPI001969C638|nr:hypothetical protein [Paraferrimonas sp. SM1919]